ncbi:hypothetical protein CROQUDRAFT_78427 [Cronartium quercuum f. sp. fusiforme G11]|uniref:C2H2-type domain-containing protein n=1 Tax=Cronartium quercuum f. sp. fusiforme G11 TaxID=708437 RepID=A0A9P6NGZ1_9BASI|nr:hypothetical protein CROQUDRAFT_78427 [Cronartium quercuum f. sp. fusiforme G11]
MSESTTTAQTHPYTCLACSLAFTTPTAQRAHYNSDLHRYNSKRRLVGLEPLPPNQFESKLLSNNFKSTTTNINQHHNINKCESCKKSFASEGAYSTHLNSKKHKSIVSQNDHIQINLSKLKVHDDLEGQTKLKKDINMNETNQTTQEIQIEKLIENRIKTAPIIGSTECLFCTSHKSNQFKDLDTLLDHMLKVHGFFLPDQMYLKDKLGLIQFISDRLRIWNICLWCNLGFGGNIGEMNDNFQKQKDLAKIGLERVRKHMCDKNHCKLAWDEEKDRLEYSDFFDYTDSHKPTNNKTNDGEGEWEDESNNSTMEIDSNSDSEELPKAPSFGTTPYELVLPNGTKLGHRSLQHIYKQNLLPYPLSNSDSSMIRTPKHPLTILANQALIPSTNGQIVKARNVGEAKEAGRHIREFRDAKRREAFKTRIGCTSGNNQKHYRDPLLQ